MIDSFSGTHSDGDVGATGATVRADGDNDDAGEQSKTQDDGIAGEADEPAVEVTADKPVAKVNADDPVAEVKAPVAEVKGGNTVGGDTVCGNTVGGNTVGGDTVGDTFGGNTGGNTGAILPADDVDGAILPAGVIDDGGPRATSSSSSLFGALVAGVSEARAGVSQNIGMMVTDVTQIFPRGQNKVKGVSGQLQSEAPPLALPTAPTVAPVPSSNDTDGDEAWPVAPERSARASSTGTGSTDLEDDGTDGDVTEDGNATDEADEGDDSWVALPRRGFPPQRPPPPVRDSFGLRSAVFNVMGSLGDVHEDEPFDASPTRSISDTDNGALRTHGTARSISDHFDGSPTRSVSDNGNGRSAEPRLKKKSWGQRLNHLRLAGLKLGGEAMQITSESVESVRRRVSAPAIPTVGRLLSAQSSTGSEDGTAATTRPQSFGANFDLVQDRKDPTSSKDLADSDAAAAAGDQAQGNDSVDYNESILEVESDTAHLEFKEAVQHLLLKYATLSASSCQHALNEALTFLDRAEPFALESDDAGEYEVVITIVQARNLTIADTNGFSDPYCKLSVASWPSKIKILEERTPTIKKNLNPVWNYETRYILSTEDNKLMVDVHVWDWDLMSSDDPLGFCQVKVPLPDSKQPGVAVDTWLLLEGTPDGEIETGELRIQVSARHNTDKTKHWSPEGSLCAKAIERHEHDRFGAPIPEDLRREWWSTASYLECREIRQLMAWGETMRLDSPLQQTPEFLKLMGIDKMIWMGIPWSRRGNLYRAGLRTASKRAQESERYYDDLCRQSNAIHRRHSQDAMEIRKDMARTGHGKSFVATAEGKKSLDQVLRAYATRNPVLGYCQSLSYVGEVLMRVMEKEEEVFWCLAAICEEMLPGHYVPSMLGYKAELAVLDAVFKKFVPRFYRMLTLAEPALSIEVFTSSWLLCTHPLRAMCGLLSLSFK